jgi:hypothetical protein
MDKVKKLNDSKSAFFPTKYFIVKGKVAILVTDRVGK